MPVIFKYTKPVSPQSATDLLHKVQGNDNEALRQALSYLANHSHAALEKVVREKLQDRSDAAPLCRENDPEKYKYALQKGYCRVMPVETLRACQETSLSIVEIAKREARLHPQLPHSKGKPVTRPISHYWEQFSPAVGKTVHWLIVLPVGLGAAVAHHASHFFNRQGVSFSEIKSLLRLPRIFYMTLLSPFMRATHPVTSRFPSKFTPILVTAGCTLAYAGIYYLAQHFKFGVPKQVDKKGVFENINDQVKSDAIKKGIERTDILDLVLRHWEDVGLGLKFRIPFLKGLAGIGKTQFVEHLAWRCVYDEHFRHYGKTVLYLNASQIVKEGPNFIKDVFRTIDKQKDNVIIFFDEAHNLGRTMKNAGNLLEEFKTLLVKENIRCIMASTEKEFEQYIRRDGAFVDRTKEINMKGLNEELTKGLLHDLQLQYGAASVLPEAITEILSITEGQKDRASPRKELQALQEVLGAAQVWRPRITGQKLLNQKLQETAWMSSYAKKNFENEQWILSDEAGNASSELAKMGETISQYETEIAVQQQALKEIEFLRSCKKRLEKKIIRLAHAIAEQPSPELEKKYFATKFILHPHVRKALAQAAGNFKTRWEEEIPLQIDATFARQVLSP